MSGFWVWLLGAVVVPVLVGEITDWWPWLAVRVLRMASRMIPASQRQDQLEFWLGELDVVLGRP